MLKKIGTVIVLTLAWLWTLVSTGDAWLEVHYEYFETLPQTPDSFAMLTLIAVLFTIISFSVTLLVTKKRGMYLLLLFILPLLYIYTYQLMWKFEDKHIRTTQFEYFLTLIK